MGEVGGDTARQGRVGMTAVFEGVRAAQTGGQGACGCVFVMEGGGGVRWA